MMEVDTKRLLRIRDDINALIFALARDKGLTVEEMIRQEERREASNARRRELYALRKSGADGDAPGTSPSPLDELQMLLFPEDGPSGDTEEQEAK